MKKTGAVLAAAGFSGGIGFLGGIFLGGWGANHAAEEADVLVREGYPLAAKAIEEKIKKYQIEVKLA